MTRCMIWWRILVCCFNSARRLAVIMPTMRLGHMFSRVSSSSFLSGIIGWYYVHRRFSFLKHDNLMAHHVKAFWIGHHIVCACLIALTDALMFAMLAFCWQRAWRHCVFRDEMMTESSMRVVPPLSHMFVSGNPEWVFYYWYCPGTRVFVATYRWWCWTCPLSFCLMSSGGLWFSCCHWWHVMLVMLAKAWLFLLLTGMSTCDEARVNNCMLAIVVGRLNMRGEGLRCGLLCLQCLLQVIVLCFPGFRAWLSGFAIVWHVSVEYTWKRVWMPHFMITPATWCYHAVIEDIFRAWLHIHKGSCMNRIAMTH